MEFGERAKKFFQDNIFFLVVLVTCVGYVLLGLVDIVKKDKSVLEILADGAMALLMGFFIGKLLSLQGVLKGEKSQLYKATVDSHDKLCTEVNGHIDKLDEFCRLKTKEAEDFIKTNILGQVGIKYTDYLEGKYDHFNRKDLPKNQYKAIKKAKKVKITALTTEGLMGSYSSKDDPYNLGDTKEKRLVKDDGRAWITKILTAVLFGYFGVSMITEFSWANVIWTAVQVIVFVASGFGRYVKSYFFVTDDLVNRIKKQDNYLRMFQEWCNKGEQNGK